MRRLKLVSLAVAAIFAFAPVAYASSTVSYAYDARGRLIAVTLSGGAHSGASIQYTYDTGNNRVRKLVTGA
jgi:hypothetical protein